MSAAPPPDENPDPANGSPDQPPAAERVRMTSAAAGTHGGSYPVSPNPSSQDLTLVVRQTGTTVDIAASGEWSLAHHHTATAAIQTALDRDADCVVLDLSQLGFIDSTGIADLLELHTGCARRKIHLVIVPGGPAIQRIFEVAGLIDSLPFLARKP